MLRKERGFGKNRRAQPGGRRWGCGRKRRNDGPWVGTDAPREWPLPLIFGGAYFAGAATRVFVKALRPGVVRHLRPGVDGALLLARQLLVDHAGDLRHRFLRVAL